MAKVRLQTDKALKSGHVDVVVSGGADLSMYDNLPSTMRERDRAMALVTEATSLAIEAQEQRARLRGNIDALILARTSGFPARSTSLALKGPFVPSRQPRAPEVAIVPLRPNTWLLRP
jgi:adenine/guanine phosphoribosyltransferase-like PRPP-binding protein